jgi:hypothetical protein
VDRVGRIRRPNGIAQRLLFQGRRATGLRPGKSESIGFAGSRVAGH